MRRIVATVAGVGLLMALGTARAGGSGARVLEARQATRLLGSRLKGALGEALRKGGPERAISVCRDDAPAIEAKVAAGSSWQVGRTSLRWRNPDNAPDAWERRVMERFESRGAEGETLGGLEFSEVVETGGVRVFRYMKAIPTGRVCLSCHGSALDPAVSAAIRAAYPDDRATGFAEGELRGAFTLKKPVP